MLGLLALSAIHADHPSMIAPPLQETVPTVAGPPSTSSKVKLMAPWGGKPESSPASLGPASVGPASVGPASLGPASVGPASLGPASVGPASSGPASLELASLELASLGPASGVPELEDELLDDELLLDDTVPVELEEDELLLDEVEAGEPPVPPVPDVLDDVDVGAVLLGGLVLDLPRRSCFSDVVLLVPPPNRPSRPTSWYTRSTHRRVLPRRARPPPRYSRYGTTIFFMNNVSPCLR